MKTFLLILGMLCSCLVLSAQLVINEISYNPPESGTDSLEYIELYNAGDADMDLSGYTMGGVDYTFEAGYMLNSGSYVLICESASAMQAVFGISDVLVWEGALSNGGEDISVMNSEGTVVDIVDFDDESPWPTSAEGTDNNGASIELCDPFSDNNLGESWRAATNDVGVMIDGKAVLGTPGMANNVSCAAEPDHIVTTQGLEFVPADITIQVGETIRWENPSGTHNVNGGTDAYPNNPEGFYSGPATPGPWTYDFTFTMPGVYNYHCDPHLGLGMVGTVTVEEPVVNTAPLVFTEIMYNDPLMDDVIEFLEITNTGDVPVELEGYRMSQGVDFTFPAYMLAEGASVVIAASSSELMTRFGIEALQWTEGGLSNSGETIELVDAQGNTVDMLTYDDSGDWTEMADGLGSSLILCDPMSDNSMGSAWGASTYGAGFSLEDIAIRANPGSPNSCVASVGEVTVLDEMGLVTFQGDTRLLGTVYGVNLRPGGLQFTLIDDMGDGIAVFSGDDNFGYEVTEGDNVYVDGSIGQFNGLAQIYASGIELVSMGNDLVNPTVVTVLNEETESQLVTIENVSLVDMSQWSGSGSGFNVDVTDGTNMFTVRIDADVDLYNMGAPTGTFNVTGLGGQFDNSAPHESGYQLLPRYVADISPYVPFVETYPEYAIVDVIGEDENGVADSLEVTCALRGVVHGINFRPSGLQFWIMDENNNGINVFNFTGDLGYTVTEGDEVRIEGTIDQWRGLTEIVPDNVEVMSTGNDLQSGNVKDDALTESDESTIVAYDVITFNDSEDWVGDGSSFSMVGTTGSGAMVEVFFDSDTEFADMATAPGDGTYKVKGIVSQNDQEDPLDGDYSIWVRYASDFSPISNTVNINDSELISIYPNPASHQITIDTPLNIEGLIVTDVAGRIVSNQVSNQLDITSWKSGVYIIQVLSQGNTYVQRVLKL